MTDLVPYILQGFLGLVAVLALLKDWKDYGKGYGRFKKHFRRAALFVTVAVIILSLIDTHNTRRDAREKEAAAAKKDAASTRQIEVLTEQVNQERGENRDNANGFRQSFTALYNKYSELAAKTQNLDLLRELADTKKELKQTEDKLTQPKAKLTVSFWHPNMSFDNLVQETTVSRAMDGSVSLDLDVVNPTDVAALDGTVTIRICSGCKYVEEPEGFVHMPGSDEQDRQFHFQRLLSNSGDQKRTIKVAPPSPVGLNRFEVDMLYSCVNCLMSKVPMWVNVQ
jgi:hypothetical protein